MTYKVESLLDESREMLRDGKDVQAILTFARHRGCSKTDAMRLLMLLRDMSLAEAKQVVHFSEAWRDTKQQDEEFQDRLQSVIEDKRSSDEYSAFPSLLPARGVLAGNTATPISKRYLTKAPIKASFR